MPFPDLARFAGRLGRRWRQAQMIARALAEPTHPVLAQIVATRRCNLSCAYCNEFDDHSAPVPTEVVLARIDRLAALGTTMVDVTGGEPLLHPDLDAIVRRIRRRGMLAGLLTNGYPLTAPRIERLNRAGLDHLQISIDNRRPDQVSRKSLDVLEPRLRLLARHARFDVNINSVVGGGLSHPEDALMIARQALTLGFSTTVGIIHGPTGRLVPLGPSERHVHDTLARLGKPFYSVASHNAFQRNLVDGRPNAWHCAAGARYLYVCEDGLVHWCSQQRGHPALPLDTYTTVDLVREGARTKSCAPFCTVSCVHRVAFLDRIRTHPEAALGAMLSPDVAGARPPRSMRALQWLLVAGPHRHVVRRAAGRVLGARRAVHHATPDGPGR